MSRDTAASALAAAVALTGVLCAAAVARAVCIGDCPPPDGQVAVNELVLGVNIALGSAALSACPAYDANATGGVGVEELIAAVNDALQGCPGAPTPTSGPGTPGTTPTPLMTATPTATWTLAPGPPITFFGVASADDSLQDPTGTDANGVPIYQRTFGFGFTLVVEAKGRFDSADSHPGRTFVDGGVPDLMIQSNRNLGNGSPAVCDINPPNRGGVPAINPPQLENPAAIADALNDFGCRFMNGTGGFSGRSCGEACVRFDDGEFHCKSDDSDAQFCAPVDPPMAFPSGDTLVTVRARNLSGEMGPPAQIIIRVP